jgi:transposase
MDEIGILPNFNGIAIHDFWKSYLKYTCTHGLCNAHLIRELTFIHERLTEEDETWAKELIDLLLEIKNTKEEAIRTGKTLLANDVLKRFDEAYDKIIKRGLDANPFSPPVYAKGQKKKPGRHKKTKQRNLLERLRDYKTDIIRFCKNFSVPFDNNFSERDIRMMKLKQKISGCFRSKQGAQYFARIRSFIISARKQKRNILQDLTDIFKSNTAWKNIVHFSYTE